LLVHNSQFQTYWKHLWFGHEKQQGLN